MIEVETPEAGVVKTNEQGEPLTDKSAFFGKSILVLPEQDSVAFAHGSPEWVKNLPTLVGVIGIFLAWLAYSKIPSIPSTATRRLWAGACCALRRDRSKAGRLSTGLGKALEIRS